MKGYLLLEDGTTFEGTLIGDLKHAIGEVVFNTGMTGYQEILTDPSYYRQIVVMGYPMIGNYGIHPNDHQSNKSHLAGFIVQQLFCETTHPKASMRIDAYLKDQGVSCLTGIDTRQLIKKIRSQGTMKGKIISSLEALTFHLEDIKTTYFHAIAHDVSTSQIITLAEGTPRVAVIDFGVKKGILDALINSGCGVTLFPSRSLPSDILPYKPDRILLSNGPGNPEDMMEGIYCASYFSGKIPLYGICLGHQIIALAHGGQIDKLKYGHRGTNHPVKDLNLDSLSITSQNHSYHVPSHALPESFIMTHQNLNDQSVEGMQHTDLAITSIQFHPEAGPGPKDGHYFFEALLMPQMHQMEVSS